MEKPSTDCKFCLILTKEQRLQLATPTYKKEKCEAKKLESELSSTPSKDKVQSPNPSVSVIGAVDGQGMLQSPGSGEPAGKKKKTGKNKATTSKAKLHPDKLAKSVTSVTVDWLQSVDQPKALTFLFHNTDSDSENSDRPELSIFVEEGKLSDHDQDPATTDPDQTLSEQTYRETMRGIQSFMGWFYIPDLETTASNSDDNPFAGPKL